ncbi:MAG: peptidylprolyl isomerase [Bryobacterales bacterium]|nr:peptidylprolyl isomerase [Bryobacterales bacterium]
MNMQCRSIAHLFPVGVALVLLLAGCSTSPKEKAAESVPPPVEEAKPEPAPAVYRAKFTSSKGDFVIEVTRKWAPLAADRFYTLLKDDYYPGSPVYRVQPGFVVQWGISNSPRKSSKWNQEYLEDEPRTQSNTRGTVAFATSGPGSRTMQVFVNMGNNTPLNAQGFTPFGRVVSGMETLAKMKSYGDDVDQGRLMREGGTYAEMFFPKMDRIEKAEIVTVP